MRMPEWLNATILVLLLVGLMFLVQRVHVPEAREFIDYLVDEEVTLEFPEKRNLRFSPGVMDGEDCNIVLSAENNAGFSISVDRYFYVEAFGDFQENWTGVYAVDLLESGSCPDTLRKWCEKHGNTVIWCSRTLIRR